MNESLSLLQNDLLSVVHNRCNEPQPYGLSVFSCNKPQKLHNISICAPTLLMVIHGRKEAQVVEQSLSIEPGEIMLLPSRVKLKMGSFPDQQDDLYLGLLMKFSQEALQHFRQMYGDTIDVRDSQERWHAKASEPLITALRQWISMRASLVSNPKLMQHRQVELLLLLAESGLVGNLLLNEQTTWQQKVSQLIASDPSRAWQLEEICNHFSKSESSIRRKLQAEKTSFRELLEEIRLGTGLSLLLETHLPIGSIADAAGYQSQSRFGERFKLRFGMTPSELRATSTPMDAR